MAELTIDGSLLGNSLEALLTAPDIKPGDQPSYETAKTIWNYHPLGKKMVEAPIAMAQSQEREITIPNAPEDLCRKAFIDQWRRDKCDDWIYNLHATARAYGLATLGVACEDVAPDKPLPLGKFADLDIAFSVFDPLNTAGSLVLNQDPNAIDFMKVQTVAVNGVPYHRSRTIVAMNERPVYILYTSSAFGFVGRSVFQRALFPLKSFVQSMMTDDLITKKAGVFIFKTQNAGSILDQTMQAVAGIKRWFIKVAANGNVVTVGPNDSVETLNMQNVDGAFGMARKDILENIAVSADMPAVILNSETFAQGFADGTEDAKVVARYVDRFRREMQPSYQWMDDICMRRAWNRDFFRMVQDQFPNDYGTIRYEDALYRWMNNFTAMWPSLLTEPESEKVKTDDVKLKAIIAVIEVFGPQMDPDNRAMLFQWAQDNLNENKVMFKSALDLDVQAIAEFQPQGLQEPEEPKPFAANDSAGRKRIKKLSRDQLADLVDMMERQPENLPLRTPLAALAKPNGHANGAFHA